MSFVRFKCYFVNTTFLSHNLNISLSWIRKLNILEIGHLNSFSPAWMNDSDRRAIKDREGLKRLEDASKRGLINNYKMFIIINTSLERFRAVSFTSRVLCAFQMTVSVYVREGRSHQPTVKQFQQRLLSTSLSPPYQNFLDPPLSQQNIILILPTEQFIS